MKAEWKSMWPSFSLKHKWPSVSSSDIPYLPNHEFTQVIWDLELEMSLSNHLSFTAGKCEFVSNAQVGDLGLQGLGWAPWEADGGQSEDSWENANNKLLIRLRPSKFSGKLYTFWALKPSLWFSTVQVGLRVITSLLWIHLDSLLTSLLL